MNQRSRPDAYKSLQRRFRSEEGSKLRAEKERLVRFYQHVQREIKPLEVSNKYSTSLDFKADNHRSRRDNNKYLVMLECLTLLFQNQREQITTNSNNKVTVKTHLIDMALVTFWQDGFSGQRLTSSPRRPETSLRRYSIICV